MTSSFRKNLRDELDFQNMTVKELSAMTGIPKPTLDCYLGSRQTIPTADIAVKIANALNVSVEYLVTGHDKKIVSQKYEQFLPYRDILFELNSLDKKTLSFIKEIIKLSAKWSKAN